MRKINVKKRISGSKSLQTYRISQDVLKYNMNKFRDMREAMIELVYLYQVSFCKLVKLST